MIYKNNIARNQLGEYNKLYNCEEEDVERVNILAD